MKKRHIRKIPVILFGDHIAAYGVIRALGPQKIPIYIVSQNGKGLCTHSRYVTKTLTLNESDADFINKLKKWISLNIGTEAVLMIAGDDQYLDILSKNHSSLGPNLKCTFPPWNIVKKVRNKRETYKIAESIGIPVPQTFFIKSEQELKDLLSGNINMRYPLLMKSEESKKFLKKYKTKGVVSNNEWELFENYSRYDGFMGELLLQEMIPGDENQLLNFIGTYNKYSDPIQIFMNRKRRSSGQFLSCTLMESMWSQEVLEYSNLLIKEIGYYGYVNPEFKYDKRDGKIRLMEINGRISMSNSHALRCGNDIISAMYEDAIDPKRFLKIDLKKDYADNILWWMPNGDLQAAKKLLNNNEITFSECMKSLSGTGYIVEPFFWRDYKIIPSQLAALLKAIVVFLIK